MCIYTTRLGQIIYTTPLGQIIYTTPLGQTRDRYHIDRQHLADDTQLESPYDMNEESVKPQ